jgi:hypothetical protein
MKCAQALSAFRAGGWREILAFAGRRIKLTRVFLIPLDLYND